MLVACQLTEGLGKCNCPSLHTPVRVGVLPIFPLLAGEDKVHPVVV